MAEQKMTGVLDTDCRFTVYYDDEKKVVTGYKIENKTKQRCIVEFKEPYKELSEVKESVITTKTIDLKIQPAFTTSRDGRCQF